MGRLGRQHYHLQVLIRFASRLFVLRHFPLPPLGALLILPEQNSRHLPLGFHLGPLLVFIIYSDFSQLIKEEAISHVLVKILNQKCAGKVNGHLSMYGDKYVFSFDLTSQWIQLLARPKPSGHFWAEPGSLIHSLEFLQPFLINGPSFSLCSQPGSGINPKCPLFRSRWRGSPKSREPDQRALQPQQDTGQEEIQPRSCLQKGTQIQPKATSDI